MDFLRFCRLIFRHKWVLLALVTLATAATFVGARLKGVTYEATATLMPQAEALQAMNGTISVSNELSGAEAPVSGEAQRDRVRSLVALMLSPRVLGEVIAKLHINATPADLVKMIQVEAVTPQVLRIRATASTPEQAQDLANGLASTFVDFYGDLRTTTIEESTKLLNDQEAQARKESERCKIAVQKYKSSHRISSLTDQLNGAINRLNAIHQAREGTAAQLAELDAQLRQSEAQLATTPMLIQVQDAVTDSPTALQLRAEIAGLERDLAVERGIHTEAHPRVRQLKAELDSATKRLHWEEIHQTPRVHKAPNPAYAGLQARVSGERSAQAGLAAKMASYERSAAGLEREMQGYTGADLQLAQLMQQLSMAEQRYSGVLARLQQAQTNADAIRRSSAIAIVDTSGPTNPPVDISKGKTLKLTVAAFVLSLVMGIFVLAAWDYTDRRVRTSADAEALVELPVAGIVPRSLPRPATAPLPQLAALMPSSPETEAYRFLSLPLLLSRSDNPVRVLMMATARPGQGATTTISNLAVTLAQGNRRVILVDADLRRPALHKVFELPNEVGLTTVLAEGLPVERALQSTLLPNLALLSSGPEVENPWALLRSTAMEGLVRRLRQMADFVLIDTPCAAAFADAYNVAPLVDGVFMVLRARHQPTGIEMKIKQMFEEAGARVCGAVLNDVPINSVESCRYYAQHYASGARAEKVAKVPALPAGRS
jgi:capsular exopolysaccharide synthesis family protein